LFGHHPLWIVRGLLCRCSPARGITAVLLTEELRVIGLVLPLAIVTALLVVYVGW